MTAPTSSSGAVSPNARASDRIEPGEDPGCRVRQHVAPHDLPPGGAHAVAGLPDARRARPAAPPSSMMMTIGSTSTASVSPPEM